MEILRQIAGACVVLALLGGTLWWLRRRGFAHFAGANGKPVRRLQMIERLPLAAQHSLHLVRLADRAILISVSPSGCRLLESSEWKAIENREAAR